MTTRMSFGGNDRISVERDNEMFLKAYFRALLLTSAVRGRKVESIAEIYPANALFPIRVCPDVVALATTIRGCRIR